MPVKIRLRRMGRKKQPHYRIVVADSASPRDGRFVETLGYYKPLTNPARVVLNLERVDFWMGKGAQPSGTVRSLISKVRMGGNDTIAVGEVDHEAQKAAKAAAVEAKRAKEAEEAAAAQAEAKAAAEAEAKAAAEAETKAAAEAEAEAAPEGEAVAEESAEGEAAPEAEAEEAPKED